MHSQPHDYLTGYNVFVSSGRFVIGIDEVGRGPLAGPICVGAVIMPVSLSWEDFQGLKDSKKLSPKRRDEWAARVLSDARIKHATAMVDAGMIDKIGIVPSASMAVERALHGLARVFEGGLLEQYEVRLDAGLRAPARFKNQTSIVRGDETEVPIALASIMAKVERDGRMTNLSAQFPEYGFEKHKGYGTALHVQAIQSFGLCELHRASFCRGLVP